MLSINNNPCALYPSTPLIGMVIGTFGTVPYIHLQLEARRRFFPHVPCLINDDASSNGPELFRLTKEYVCNFHSNDTRLHHSLGDVSVFVNGLKWARSNGLDILLKVSRRFIFLTDWTQSLSALAKESQFPTFCNFTSSFGFQFRSEAAALSVKLWSTEILRELNYATAKGKTIDVENVLHNMAKKCEQNICLQATQWRSDNHCNRGYAEWQLLGTDRMRPSMNYLWHDWAGFDKYALLAQSWGLPYSLDDFKSMGATAMSPQMNLRSRLRNPVRRP